MLDIGPDTTETSQAEESQSNHAYMYSNESQEES